MASVCVCSRHEPRAAGVWQFPSCIETPDHLHIIYGCFEGAAKSSTEWLALERAFRNLSQLMSSVWLLRRFQARCLQGPLLKFSRLLGTCGNSKFEWKWEYSERFWRRLLEVLPALRAGYSVERMASGDGEISEVHTAVATGVAEALAAPFVAGEDVGSPRNRHNVVDCRGEVGGLRMSRGRTASCPWGRRAVGARGPTRRRLQLAPGRAAGARGLHPAGRRRFSRACGCAAAGNSGRPSPVWTQLGRQLCWTSRPR